MSLTMLTRVEQARKRAAKIRAARTSPTSNPPAFPEYLQRQGLQLNAVTRLLADITASTREKERRVVIATPPRHGKTDTLLHAVAWLLAHDPTRLHAYATYGQELANSKSRRARRLAQETGVHLASDSQSVKEWRTSTGGGMLATGAGGPLTGQGITGLGVVDDPFKNRQEVESSLIRERAWEWFKDVFYTRLEPGASAIVIATRWHPDDLSGRLIAEGWESITMPAINQDGEALWPERYPVDRLEEIRAQVGEYTWASLYQGTPRPRGGTVFNEPTYYDHLPDGGYNEAHGFDAAYTAKTHADYSVTLTGRRYGDSLYVTNMIREQREPRQYIARLQAANIQQVTWMLSGAEKGLVAFLRDQGVQVQAITATGDKFVRAQPAAATWNDNRVLLPRNEPWVDDVLAEVQSFTGVNDQHDDIVDALAALHHALFGPEPRARII